MSQNDLIVNAELRIDESKLRQSVNRIEQQLRFKGPFAGMAADVTRFDHELNRATQRVITLGTAFQLLGTAARTIRSVVDSTVEVEKALTDINSVFRLTNENLSKFSGNLFNIARETAKSFDEVAKAGAEFARQGLSVQKTQEAVRAAMILSRDANIDVTVSVRALTAAVNSFQKEGLGYSQVINRLAAADSAFAVSSKDLQDALIRVGSAASDAGVSFNELIALVTSAQQITARGGSVIAGALNTIFTRLNRRDTLDALEALGVAISDTQGRMLPTLNVLQNFSKAYDKMTGSVKNQAAELVGGVRQLNTLKAVLTDLSQTNSVFAQSLREVENAQDAAERRNAARNQSLSARMSQLQESGRQIGSNIGTLGFESQAKGALSFLNNNPVTEALRNAGDLTNDSFGAEAGRAFIKGFGNAITFGLTPILAAVAFKVSKRVFANLTEDVKSLTVINGAAQEHANLEKQIIALYQQGGAALQQQLATMTSLNQQAAVFARLIASSQGASIGGSQASAIASIIMAQRARTPRAADGYVPMGEEASAISRGIGGAPSSARPVYLPNFDRGGGKKGIVANTSEFIVPNLAGGSAIYNREMIQKHGLPPGSVPVAAGGYIPNAAESWLGSSPTTSLQAAVRRMEQKEMEESALVAKILSQQVIKPMSSVDYANSMIGGASLFAPGGSIGSRQRSRDFGLAEAEIISQTSGIGSFEEDKRKALREKRDQLAEMERQLDKERDLVGKKTILTKQDIKQSEEALRVYRAVSSVDVKKAMALGRASTYREYDPTSIIGYGEGTTVAEAIANRGYGDSYNDYLERRARGPKAPPPPAPVIPSFRDRMAARLSGPMGTASAMGLAMGLPFIGAQIDPGMGGTASGMWRGAASNALSFAGFGASAGMMTGNPFGPLVGAGIGAAIGGLVGVLGKLTQSFEELTTELDQSRKKMVESYEKGAQFLRLQEELEVAKSSGQAAKALEISRNQVQLLANLPENVRSEVLGLRGNPQASAIYAQSIGKGLMAQDASASFRTATNKLLSGDIYSPEGKGVVEPGLRQAMASMSPQDLKTLESKIESGDITGAVKMLSLVSGSRFDAIPLLTKLEEEKNPSIFRSMISGFGPTSPMASALSLLGFGLGNTTGQTKASLTGALGGLNTLRNKIDQTSPSVALMQPRQISKIISALEMENIRSGIQSSGQQQLFQAGQSASLNQPMSARDRLALEGQYALDAISFQSQISQSQAFSQGRLGVSQALRSAGVRDAGLFSRAGGLNSIEGALSFRRDLDGRQLAGAIDPTKIDQVKNSLDEIIKTYFQIEETEKSTLDVTSQINKMKLEEFDLEKDYKRVKKRLLDAAEEEAERRESASLAMLGLRGSPFISGSQIESGLMGGAVNQGMFGNARGSFIGGFQARFAGLKQDMLQFAEIGNRVAQSLESNLGNAFGDFVTGTTTAKNAFRSFAISVLSDTSRMFASKAFQSVLSAIPGFTPAGATGGEFTGTGFRFAAGGMVPALLTGGEFYVSPKAAKRIGYDTLRQINRYAEGGLVRGGSGVKDDVPARLPPGSFIVRKSATERLGSDYLQSLVDGRVQGRFLGGVLMGGLLGGGLGYAIGGKKGALIGAGIGAIGGAMYGNMGQVGSPSTQSMLSVSSPSPDLAAVAAEPATMMSPMSVSASRIAAASAPWWKTAAYGLGAAGLLGVAAQAFSPKSGPGPISADQVPGYRAALEAQQNQMFSSNRYAYLTVNPQGGYSLGSFGTEPATRRWADGGVVSSGVDTAMVPGPHSGGNGAQVSVKIEINNNGQVSSKSGSSNGDDGPFGSDFGQKLEKAVRPIVQDELVRQSRNDGFFSQKSRYMNG